MDKIKVYYCNKCNAPLDKLEEDCPVCGHNNAKEEPEKAGTPPWAVTIIVVGLFFIFNGLGLALGGRTGLSISMLLSAFMLALVGYCWLMVAAFASNIYWGFLVLAPLIYCPMCTTLTKGVGYKVLIIYVIVMFLPYLIFTVFNIKRAIAPFLVFIVGFLASLIMLCITNPVL